ncbi:hypothetical protein D3C76_1697300 [compost metagenome]
MPTAMLFPPEAEAPAPPASALSPVTTGLDRLLVLFTWNIPSVPLAILVMELLTLVISPETSFS